MAGLNNMKGKRAARFTKGGTRAQRVARAKAGLRAVKGKDLSQAQANILDLDWAAWNAGHRGNSNVRPAAGVPAKMGKPRREISNFQKSAGVKNTSGHLNAPTVHALKSRAASATAEHPHLRAKAILAASRGNVGRANKLEAARKAFKTYKASAPKPRGLGQGRTRNFSNATETLDLAVLSAAERKALPTSAFVFPGKRAYPIHDKAHAENALARSAGKPEHAAVKAAVRKRYPDLGR